MKILIAADCGNNFNAALEFLKSSSWSAESEFKILHVIEPSDVSDLWLSMSGATRYRGILTERQQHAQATIEEIKTECLELLGHDFKLDTDVVIGKLDEVVIHAALEWGAELVVVGLPESTFISRCIGTSRFSKVFSDAPCPVTFARTSRKETRKAS